MLKGLSSFTTIFLVALKDLSMCILDNIMKCENFGIIFSNEVQGTSRTCYLPDNDAGKEVLRLLKIAWGKFSSGI